MPNDSRSIAQNLTATLSPISAAGSASAPAPVGNYGPQRVMIERSSGSYWTVTQPDASGKYPLKVARELQKCMDREREEPYSSVTNIVSFENRAPRDGDSDDDSSAFPQVAGGDRAAKK